MTTIVTISPIIPVGPRISSRSFPRESQRTAAARSAFAVLGRWSPRSTVFDLERWVSPLAGATRARRGPVGLFQHHGRRVPSSAQVFRSANVWRHEV